MERTKEAETAGDKRKGSTGETEDAEEVPERESNQREKGRNHRREQRGSGEIEPTRAKVGPTEGAHTG